MRRHAYLPLIAGAALGAMVLAAPVATAQMRMITVDSRGFSGVQAGRINSGSLSKYGELLSLDGDQQMVAEELLKGYTAEMQQAERDRRETVQRLMAEYRELEDHSALRDEMPEAMAEFRERAEAIERQFFDDLKLLLGDGQLARWERVERFRRRETVLARGMISGETIDLIAMSDAIGVEVSKEIREVFAQYERDLDRLLIEKRRMARAAAEDGVTPGEFDGEKMRERMKASRELGLKISDVNERYARRVESMLSAEAGVRFADEVKKRTFPRVYRESHVDRLIGASESLEDLDDAQAGVLREIKLAYARARAAADDRWANAIRERDASGEGDSGFMVGGMVVRMDFGDGDEDDPVSRAKSARREIDQQYEAKVLAALEPAQREKMPQRGGEPQEDGGFVIEGAEPSSGVFIRRGGG